MLLLYGSQSARELTLHATSQEPDILANKGGDKHGPVQPQVLGDAQRAQLVLESAQNPALQVRHVQHINQHHVQTTRNQIIYSSNEK